MDQDNLITFLIIMIFVLIFSFFVFYSWNSDKQKYQLIPMFKGEIAILLNTSNGDLKLIRFKESNVELEMINIYENPYINNKLTKEYCALDEKTTEEFLKELKNSDNEEDLDNEIDFSKVDLNKQKTKKFDITTAKVIEEPKKRFDITTAKVVDEDSLDLSGLNLEKEQ